MSVRMRVEVLGAPAISRRVGRYAARVTDASPVFERMAEEFRSEERQQFATEGAYGGTGWAPLNPVYAAWKATRYPGKGILRATDRLFTSLTQAGSPDAVNEVGPDFFQIGTRVPYYEFHASGTANMPARPPIQLTLSMRRRWMQMMREYVAGDEFGGVTPVDLTGFS